MTARERVLARERERGRADATALQAKAEKMTGAELYGKADRIPRFEAARKRKNMLNRKPGFTCLSPSGRVVKLIQPYDSEIYPQPPEELPAQWGFKWSTDPAHALPFVQIATSPYGKGECCTQGGKIWRSNMDGNVHSPADYPRGWVEISVENV